MSSIKNMTSRCDFCGKDENFTLIVDCDFQVCEKHLIEQKPDSDTKKIKCLVCQNEFDLEECKKTPHNQLRLLTRDFETKHQELLERLKEYTLYKNDLESIKNANFQEIRNLIDKRKLELEAKLQEALYREYNNIINNLETIKDIYLNEIVVNLSQVDLNDTIVRFNSIKKDLLTKNVPPNQKIEILKSNINEINKKYEELQAVKISLEKSKNVEFKKKESEFKFENLFGTLNYKSGALRKFDRIDITNTMTLESVFGFVDYSGAVLPDFEKIRSKKPTVLNGHCAKVTKIDQLPNGDLISSSDDCTIKIWNIKTGQCSNTLIGHSNSVKSFKLLSPTELVSVSTVEKKSSSASQQSIRSTYTSNQLSSIIIWNLNNGLPIHYIQGHKSTLHTVDALDEDVLVTGDADGQISFWSVNSGNAINVIKAHSGPIYSVIVQNKETIVSASADVKIKIWNLVQGEWKQKGDSIEGHSSYVWCLTKVNDTQFLSGANDYDIKLWSLNSESSLMTFSGHKDTVRSIKLLENDQFLSASSDGALILWDLKTGNKLENASLDKQVQSINLSKAGDLIVACNFSIEVYKSL